MIGKKFGEWTVVRRVENYKTNINYECRCSCGALSNVRRTYLINGRSTKCRTCAGNGLVDIVGKKFGKTTIVSVEIDKYDNGRQRRRFVAKCECGKIRTISGQDARRGRSNQCKSCSSITHGKSASKIYLIHKSMMDRCYNQKSKAYYNYGGRGIKVCDRWHDFENFYKDVGDKPNGLELDRTNPDGNYEPGNCKWITRKENQANRRNSIKNRNKFIMVARCDLCKKCMTRVLKKDMQKEEKVEGQLTLLKGKDE
jgi:hypothetical protein